MTWTTLRAFHTARFSVALQYAYDQYVDLSDFDAVVQQQITQGVFDVFTFRVVVLCNGREVGADYLGNSVYSDPSDFAREHYGTGTTGTGGRAYFSDMLRNAIDAARNELSNLPRVRR